MPRWDLRWILSLLPLVIPTHFPQRLNSESNSDALSFLPPLHFGLSSVLTYLLHPSLTSTELRMIATALINFLVYASSPQAIILKAVLWGGGLGILILCEDVIKWNVNLARVPSHKLRRAGNAIISIGRWKELTSLRAKGQASDSEGELLEITSKASKSARPKSASQKSTSIYSICTVHAYRKAGSDRLINPRSSDLVIKILHMSYTHNVAFLPHTSYRHSYHSAFIHPPRITGTSTESTAQSYSRIHPLRPSNRRKNTKWFNPSLDQFFKSSSTPRRNLQHSNSGCPSPHKTGFTNICSANYTPTPNLFTRLGPEC